MSIDRFSTIVAPPKLPVEVPDDLIWKAVQSSIAPLPKDYRDFVDAYGTGSIDSFIWIFNPVSTNSNLNLNHQVGVQLRALKELNEMDLESQLVLFPDESGLLPFGITDNGDILLWQTAGDEDKWTVSVLPSRSSSVLRFEANTTDFLAGVCAGSIRCKAFPDDFPSAKPAFTN